MQAMISVALSFNSPPSKTEEDARDDQESQKEREAHHAHCALLDLRPCLRSAAPSSVCARWAARRGSLSALSSNASCSFCDFPLH